MPNSQLYPFFNAFFIKNYAMISFFFFWSWLSRKSRITVFVFSLVKYELRYQLIIEFIIVMKCLLRIFRDSKLYIRHNMSHGHPTNCKLQDLYFLFPIQRQKIEKPTFFPIDTWTRFKEFGPNLETDQPRLFNQWFRISPCSTDGT